MTQKKYTQIKVCFLTYGCSYNQEDTDIMQSIVKSDIRFILVDNPKDSDIVVINGCVVKNPTENKIKAIIKKLSLENKKIIIAGCFGQINSKDYTNYTLIGTNSIDKIILAIESVIQNKNEHFISLDKIDKSKLLNNYFSQKEIDLKKNNIKTIQIIPISEGCLGNCTYCATKFARLNLKSSNAEDILAIFNNSLKNGIKEFWLTSQDVGCYGYDINTNIIELLKKIISKFKDKEFYIRLGMINPNYVKIYLKELIDILKDNHMFKFIHIPIQSGSDNVLKIMNRHYTLKDFELVVSELKLNVPNITISTDVIVGFPYESEFDFKLTYDLVKKYEFDVLNISRFWPKKNTLAEKMFQLDNKIIMERSKKLNDLFSKIKLKNSKKWIDYKGIVYFDELGKNSSRDSKIKDYIGRNIFYKIIVVKSKDNLLGKSCGVEIIDAEKHFLIGKID